MELKGISERVVQFLMKYRYAFLVLLVGIVLMLLPSEEHDETTEAADVPQTVEQVSVEQELEQILMSIQGAGDVRVLLSYAEGEETLYQSNTDTLTATDSASQKQDTVIISDGDRNESGLVRQVNPARFLGAIIVCQGADSAAVRLAVVEAVSKYTGLGADQIAVLKMK